MQGAIAEGMVRGILSAAANHKKNIRNRKTMDVIPTVQLFIRRAIAVSLTFALCACVTQPSASAVPQFFRDTLTTGSSGPEMAWIPAGKFRMGDLQGDGAFDEIPVHDVVIARPFAMSRFEITVQEFRTFVRATGYVTEAELHGGCMIQGGKSWHEPKEPQADNHPVICVSWNDANAYTRWLSEQSGKKYRLPTEAEWEYAARAGTTTRYSWGDTFIEQRANCWGCAPNQTSGWTLPVGSFAPNTFGLYDMQGNVWEWTASEWHEVYDGREQQITSLGHNSGVRSIRGGGWFNGEPDIRPANRGSVAPYDRYNTMGIRVVRER